MANLDKHQKATRGPGKDTSKRLNKTDRETLIEFAMAHSLPDTPAINDYKVAFARLQSLYLADWSTLITPAELRSFVKFKMLRFEDYHQYINVKCGNSTYVHYYESGNPLTDPGRNKTHSAYLEFVKKSRKKTKPTKSEYLLQAGYIPSLVGIGQVTNNATHSLTFRTDTINAAFKLETANQNYRLAMRDHRSDFRSALALCKTFRDACDLWPKFMDLHSIIQPISTNQQIRAVNPEVYKRINNAVVSNDQSP